MYVSHENRKVFKAKVHVWVFLSRAARPRLLLIHTRVATEYIDKDVLGASQYIRSPIS